MTFSQCQAPYCVGSNGECHWKTLCPYYLTESCVSCNGCGQVWEYYKEASEKVIHQLHAPCPICLPDEFNPDQLAGNDGWVEIDYEEANRLQCKDGYMRE